VLAGLTVAAAAVLTSVVPAQAAPGAEAPNGAAPGVAAQLIQARAEAPTTTSNGERTLVVDSTTDLPVENAAIAVQGKGFDVTHGLYIAVCADGSGAPAKLDKCVGGAIPDGNTGTGWAHITETGDGTGGVRAAWGPDGSFSVTLALPKVDEGDVNCVAGKCSLYTASDDLTIRTEDNAVPVTFAAPPPTSSSSTPPTSSSPTAPTSPTAPKTATVQDIATPDIEAGKTQLVIFSGFAAGEQVNLTLFSAPITLSPVTADGTGVAQARFVVPADIAPGTHRLEAIGQQSGTVGVASFRVTAPPPPPTSASSTPSTSASPSTAASSSAPASSSSSSSAAPSSSSAAPTTAVTPTNTDSGTNLWWLWLIIGIVVLAGIITAIVVYRRNKEQEQRERDEQAITDAAAREQAAGPYDAPTVVLPPVRPGGPPPGEDPYGLLSGRDHPDSPTLYSGQDPAGPTQVIGPPAGSQGPGPSGPPPAGPGQPTSAPEGPTEALRPPPAGPAGGRPGTDGPHTEAWTPDEDDTGQQGRPS
jgi:hypothetical protein